MDNPLVRTRNREMLPIPVVDGCHLIPAPCGHTIMVGAPPEALKLLVLWEFPFPSTVVLPPDPLFAAGINQASFEFLLYNHLFRMRGLERRLPFLVACEPHQVRRVETMVRHMLRGPSDAELRAWETPAAHRRLLLAETAAVSGEMASLPPEDLARVVALTPEGTALPGGTTLHLPEPGRVVLRHAGREVEVPRRASERAPLPFYFADVERPVTGPRFGLQVIGSASGFSGSEWGSCFLIWINGQPLVVDGTPYLTEHLRRLGIEDDHILGYLLTHNHEDHANALGALVGRRPVTLLTSAPVMAGLASRLSSLLDISREEVRRLFHWVPLQPGLEEPGEPLPWFGAEIRTWYSVHTIPTLGVNISLDGRSIRLPGDTLWGSQLSGLVARGALGPARAAFIQGSYEGADVLVADAGGGPIHPDPEEVGELVRRSPARIFVTHTPDAARTFLPPAEPGTRVELLPREERTPEEAMALFGSPTLRGVPERWLLALLYGGRVVPAPEPDAAHPAPLPGEADDAHFVLAGALTLVRPEGGRCQLQRGDLYHPSLVKPPAPLLAAAARWTRLLVLPGPLYRAFLRDTGRGALLERLFRTREWWRLVVGDELSLEALVALAGLCRERELAPGEAVVRQGEPAEHFYVVTAGSVAVTRRVSTAGDGTGAEEHLVGEFGPGYHFGEIALLGRETRTATVRASGPARVLEVPGLAFRRHLMEIPLARYRVGRMAARRRAQLSRSGDDGR